MKTHINIVDILGPDLKSRFAVNDLLLYIKNTYCEYVTVDFTDVKFATRSFVDEYYNVIMNNNILNINIESINIPEDIQIVFEVVKHTQHKVKNIRLDAPVVICRNIAELQGVLGSILL